MKANIQVIDAMLSVALQLTKAPDQAIARAATDELQLLAKRRAALLRQADAQSQAEDARREVPQAA